jgi:hypothetical protein
VTVGNRTENPLHVEHGDCWISVRVFATSSTTGTALFDNLGPEIDCTLPLYVLDVAPRLSVDVDQFLDLDRLHRSNVPPGTYYVLLSVKVYDTTVNGDAVTQRFQVGPVAIP